MKRRNQKKMIFIIGIILLFIIIIINSFNMNRQSSYKIKAEGKKTYNSQEVNIYDVILFWGQSNMVGTCGRADTETVQYGEREPDKRYDYTDIDSVEDYSKRSGIDKEFLSNAEKMNYVRIAQEQESVYEYKYLSNDLMELNENTHILGEALVYDEETQELKKRTGSKFSINLSSRYKYHSTIL